MEPDPEIPTTPATPLNFRDHGYLLPDLGDKDGPLACFAHWPAAPPQPPLYPAGPDHPYYWHAAGRCYYTVRPSATVPGHTEVISLPGPAHGLHSPDARVFTPCETPEIARRLAARMAAVGPLPPEVAAAHPSANPDRN